jgi:hypothetical protein
MEQETAGLDPIQIAIFTLLGLTLILCVSLYFFPSVKGDVLVINPLGTKLIVWCAYGFGIFALLGLMCIFWHEIRIPVAIGLGIYVIFFLWVCVLGKIHESLAWQIHQDDHAVVKTCKITKHKIESTPQGDTYYLNLVFSGETKEQEFSENSKPLPFYEGLGQGARAKAEVIECPMGVKFIIALHRQADFE